MYQITIQTGAAKPRVIGEATTLSYASEIARKIATTLNPGTKTDTPVSRIRIKKI